MTNPSDAFTQWYNNAKSTYHETKSQPNGPYIIAGSAFTAGVLSLLVGRRAYGRYFRRIPSAEWITPNQLGNGSGKGKWIKGVVTSVGDADNFRLYHTPGFGWRFPLKFRRVPETAKDLRSQTLHIRLAGVDAPEAAHFGKPAQPYSAEALAWLRGKVLGRRVWCCILRKDQYGRVISIVTLPPLKGLLPGTLFTGKNLSLEMLKAGWGTVYEQTGAEYGKWGKETFLKVEAQAQAARRGMWQEGTSGETPAEYKRRHAAAAAAGVTPQSASRVEKAVPTTRRWWWPF